MAKTTLATNYKDDALNSAMGGKRQYTQTTNANGTISLTDASVYDTVGSDFGASVVNEMNRNINESFDAGKIINSMTALNATTIAGYVPDALLLKEANNNFGNLTAITVTPWSTAISISSNVSRINNKLTDLHFCATIAGSLTYGAGIASLSKAPLNDLYCIPCIYRNSSSGDVGLGVININASGHILCSKAIDVSAYNQIWIHTSFLCK